jgi:hypothetical protein
VWPFSPRTRPAIEQLLQAILDELRRLGPPPLDLPLHSEFAATPSAPSSPPPDSTPRRRLSAQDVHIRRRSDRVQAQMVAALTPLWRLPESGPAASAPDSTPESLNPAPDERSLRPRPTPR